MPPVGFVPTISAGERPQTYVLDRAATGTGKLCVCVCLISKHECKSCNLEGLFLRVVNLLTPEFYI
jgi:hypothetical protein